MPTCGSGSTKGDLGWREPIAEASAAFTERGELPKDGLLREVVLADAELQALWN